MGRSVGRPRRKRDFMSTLEPDCYYWSMWRILIFSALGFCGCATYTINRSCEAELVFSDVAACVRSSATDSDHDRLYVAYIDALASRVNNGEMSEADARLGLIDMQLRLKTAARKRNARIVQAVAAGMRAGYESPPASTQHGQPVIQTYNIRDQIITCRNLGRVINCF